MGPQLGNVCHRGGEQAREWLALYSGSEHLLCVWHCGLVESKAEKLAFPVKSG